MSYAIVIGIGVRTVRSIICNGGTIGDFCHTIRHSASHVNGKNDGAFCIEREIAYGEGVSVAAADLLPASGAGSSVKGCMIRYIFDNNNTTGRFAIFVSIVEGVS